MATLLSYDISDKHEDFKKALLKAGYTDTLSCPNGRCRLPKTTLVHEDKSTEEVRDDCTGLAQDLSIALERCIAVNYIYDHWSGTRGKEDGE